jgi:hypothetical protein
MIANPTECAFCSLPCKGGKFAILSVRGIAASFSPSQRSAAVNARYDVAYASVTWPQCRCSGFRIRACLLPARACGGNGCRRNQRSFHGRYSASECRTRLGGIAFASTCRGFGIPRSNDHLRPGKAARSENSPAASQPRGIRSPPRLRHTQFQPTPGRHRLYLSSPVFESGRRKRKLKIHQQRLEPRTPTYPAPKHDRMRLGDAPMESNLRKSRAFSPAWKPRRRDCAGWLMTQS